MRPKSRVFTHFCSVNSFFMICICSDTFSAGFSIFISLSVRLSSDCSLRSGRFVIKRTDKDVKVLLKESVGPIKLVLRVNVPKNF